MNQELIRLYRNQLATQENLAARIMRSAWDALPKIDETLINVYAGRITPMLQGAQQATVSTSAAFNSRVLGIPPRAIDYRLIQVEPKVRDPFTAAWHALTEGRPYTEALDVGRSVAEAAGSDFITSTARRTGDAMTLDTTAMRWQRVASADACDWCQERSGGIYPNAEDGDYGHDRCGCIVIPYLD